MQQISDPYGRFSLTVSIMPREGSIWIYKELIMAITIMSQLDGLAGYTPANTPFCE